MKTAWVCAMIFGQFAAQGRECAILRTHRQVFPCAGGTVVSVRKMAAYPAPVAEMTIGNGPTIEGGFLRMTTAPRPLQMINPMAPPEYASAGELVTYADSDPNRTANPNKPPLQLRPDGVRLLAFRLW